MMPITDTNINGCDCPGTIPAIGVLIDDVIPSIDTAQRGTWATELFVVNRTGQDPFMFGFQFHTDIHLRGVEVTYLNFQIWGTGTSAINVYSSHGFPNFNPLASTRIGVLSLVDDTVQSCTSLTTVSIPTQPMEVSSIIYVNFSFVGGSSVHPFNWLHLAEIRFSDMEFSTITTTTTTSSFPSTAGIQGTSKVILSTTATAGLLKSTDTVVSMITVPTVPAIPITIFVGTLMGVIALLILLIFIIVILFYVYFSKCKTKETQTVTVHDNDEYDAVEREIELTGVSKTIEMKVNEAYGTCGQDDRQMSGNFESCVYEKIM